MGEAYKLRQEAATGATIDTLRPQLNKANTEHYEEKEEEKRRSPVRSCLNTVMNSELWSVVSLLVTIAQAAWIGIDVDKNDDLSLYQKPSGDIAIEFCFATFFFLEVV